jgi:hypothetical protein
MQPIFVGGIQLSVEDLLAHLDLIPPSSGATGATTYEYLQQYIMELDENGMLSVRIPSFQLFDIAKVGGGSGTQYLAHNAMCTCRMVECRQLLCTL